MYPVWQTAKTRGDKHLRELGFYVKKKQSIIGTLALIIIAILPWFVLSFDLSMPAMLIVVGFAVISCSLSALAIINMGKPKKNNRVTLLKELLE
jgi:uncharacterized membrane protein YkvA (DUF1232 family)